MASIGSRQWKLWLFLAGAFIVAGTPLHPRDPSMALMLSNPTWVPAHTLLTLGFACLLAAVTLHLGAGRWRKLAIAGTILQTIEMALHTAAVVDAHHLASGQPTPVLSAHLAMAMAAYPLFAIAIIGWIVATARERSVASPWIAWLGIWGAAAHGISAPLRVGLQLEWAWIFFPMLGLLGLWAAIAGLWPRRS